MDVFFDFAPVSFYNWRPCVLFSTWEWGVKKGVPVFVASGPVSGSAVSEPVPGFAGPFLQFSQWPVMVVGVPFSPSPGDTD